MGNKPPNYGVFDPIHFGSVYALWVYPLHHEGWGKPIPTEIAHQSNRSDIKPMLKAAFKAAIILNNEMEQKTFLSEEHSFRTYKYFDAIHQAYLLYRHSKDNYLEPALLEEYNLVFNTKEKLNS